ncbi:hypothetical protein AALP_AA8G512600 [Arabis alpina]|uniref:NYN domain-containing protein n=1 Tax=Arabis alpina TaxID=50452 RepID=A0A087GEX0_ARAAL|nr:hypothetical protein AALP_AA8G512600 [Arabis alpina]
MKPMYAAAPEFATSKTAVWWDMGDCPVPDGYDARRVVPSIEGALKKLDYSGPVSITAYGDLKHTPEHVLRRLSSTGVDLQHTVKELRCSHMYSDLLKWREHNPPPATMMLISDQVQSVFCYGLCRLQQLEHGYNLVQAYAHDPCLLSPLYSTAEWLWESLLSDSEPPTQFILQKCSQTAKSAMLHCRSCGFVGQCLANFTKHLSGEEHAQEETRVTQSTCPSVGPGYEKAKVMRMRINWKNCEAAPEFATSKTLVLWDMGDCPVPDGYDARCVRPSIEGALKKLGYSGPVSITAFGDLKQTPEHVLRRLSSTGIALHHIVEGLCRLQQREHGYNLVLASTHASTHASTQASVIVTSAEWFWETLLTDSETPRQFLLQKCSETGESAVLQCSSCMLDCQNLEMFTKHLSGEKHAKSDFNMIMSTRRRYEHKQSEEENFQRSKRLRKAFRTGFHFGNYFRITNSGSRRRTRFQK